MANAVGKVSVLHGQAFARGADGSQRALKVGDVVMEGEVVVTALGGHVELVLNGGQVFQVREQETVTLDKSVLGVDLPESHSAALLDRIPDATAISQAIALGSPLDTLLEETAAGLDGGSEGGHSFVQLLRVVEGTTASAPFASTGGSAYVLPAATGGASATDSPIQAAPRDTTRPDAPSVSLAHDTGASGTDLVTNNGALSISGTEPGATVEYSTDGSTWTNSYTPVEGANTVYVRQTDVAGNVSGSTSLSFTLDTQAPQISVIAPDHVNDTTPTITGTTDAADGSTVSLTVTQGANTYTTTAVVSGGSYSADAPSALGTGAYTVSASVADIAGNVGTSLDAGSINAAPTSTPVTLAAIGEDSGARIITQAELLANAQDADGDSLAVTGLSIATGSGSLVSNGNGTWTFTPAADDDTSVSFNYTIADGHGASVAGVATLDITPVNDVPVVADTSISISEEGLAGGIPDSAGSPDTSNAASVTGTLAVGDVDSSTLSVSLVAPGESLSSGGVALIWVGSGSHTLIGYAGSTEVVKATIDDGGHYTVTLSKGIDQPAGAGENSSTIGIGVRVSDGSLTSSGTINVTVEDDSPTANAPSVSLAGADASTNLSVVLDLSGSMGSSSGMAGLTRLQATVAAIRELIDSYDSQGNLMVNITTFGASAVPGTWITAAQAMTYLDTVSANMGNTNYDGALSAAMSAFQTSGKLNGSNAQNVLYFLSDGAPNLGDGDASTLSNGTTSWTSADVGIQDPERLTWQGFLVDNGISAYAIGLGSGVTTTSMDPIAYDGIAGADRSSVAVTDLANLNSVLASTITNSISGTFAGGGGAAGGFGGDGGRMAVVSYGAETFDFDGSALAVTGSGAAYTFNSSTHVLTITAMAGTFVVDMDTGAYTYTTSTNPAVSQETFGYTLRDADGDAASGSLTITLTGHDDAPIGRNDLVLVASDSVSTNAVAIKDSWLTWNDSDAEGSALSISAVSNATSHIAGQVVDAVTSSSGGTGAFSYSVSDGSQTDTASVSIRTTNSTTLAGNGLDNIIIGDASGETISGYEGNDVLAGNAGNDAIGGGAGRDLIIGGTGSDTLTGGAGADTFQWMLGDAAGSPTDRITDFGTAAPASGGDVLDLRDLLVGESHVGIDPGNLANYLHFSYSGGNTTVTVTTHDASATTQTIVLNGVNLVGSYTTDAQIIQNLLSNNKLVTD